MNLLQLLIGISIIVFSSCLQDPETGPETLDELFQNGWGISSASVFVDNLDTATQYYSEVLGFTGPRRPGFNKDFDFASRSLMFALPDMSAINLIGPYDTLSVIGEDTIPANLQSGMASHLLFALSTSSVENSSSWLKSRNFLLDTIIGHRFSADGPDGWDRDDGEAEVLRLVLDLDSSTSYLPVFDQLTSFPYERMNEWNTFYNMQRSFKKNPNGVVGMDAVLIQVDDIQNARKKVLQLGLPLDDGESSEEQLCFKLKQNQKMFVKSHTLENSEETLKSGTGMYGLRLEVENMDSTLAFFQDKLPASAIRFDSLTSRLTIDKEYAYGLQLEFIQEPEEQALAVKMLDMNFQDTLSLAAQENAEAMYLKYCALCHGEKREGYAADFAPSLRSKSLISTAYTTNFLRYTIQYGRAGTAMGGYYDKLGGPMEYIEIELLLKWLYEKSGVEAPVQLSREPVKGDIAEGALIYANKCSACHGSNGEGISAPALGNPMLLATATDEFLKYAITNGRDSSLMPAFKDSLSEIEINNVTAFLRSRASGWDLPEGDSISVPQAEDYVLNPDGPSPDFDLRDGLYLPAVQLNKALEDSTKIILLDARSEVAWRQTHIPGAIPVPYYKEPEEFVNDIPKDDTWIVAYCACPHAASQKVINTLKRYGYEKIAILDEGILVWASMGFPVLHGG